MTVDIASIFKAVGPAASVIFAAWIFMAFLQTRYDAAVDRYRALIGEYRQDHIPNTRRANLHDSILVYKKRCDIMNVASVTGLTSAILLISALIIGELALALPGVEVLKGICVGCTLAGLFLVIVATCVVIYESRIIHRQLEAELLDLPALAEETGEAPGKISDDAETRDAKARDAKTRDVKNRGASGSR